LERSVDADGGFGAFVVFEAGEGVVGEAGGVAALGEGEAFDFTGENELGVIDEVHAVGGGEALRAFSDEVDVWALFEDEAGGLDGVAEALDAGNAAGFHAAAVHEEGVELDAAVGGEEAAAAGVEGRVIFENGDGGLDGIEGGAAAREDCVTRFEGSADAGLMSLGCIVGDGPCATVDEEDGVASGVSWHGVMVPQMRVGARMVKRVSGPAGQRVSKLAARPGAPGLWVGWNGCRGAWGDKIG
jgi:hypothetical protein